MKAITLHQPHAHLIGLGVKPFETRSWKTNYRGLLAIHAAKIQIHELDGLVVDPNDDHPTFLEPYNHYLPADWNDYFGDLNHGGIECLAVLKCVISAPTVHQSLLSEASMCETDDARRVFQHAAAFGNFGAGRWAWRLDVRIVVQGNRGGVVRGYQDLWDLPSKVEKELLSAYREQTGGMICRVCGCTDDSACKTPHGPCHWVSDFLCSACSNKVS